MPFTLFFYENDITRDVKYVQRGNEFETLEELFNYLSTEEKYKLETAKLHSVQHANATLESESFDVVYEEFEEATGQVRFNDESTQHYYIRERKAPREDSVTFAEFLKARNDWAERKQRNSQGSSTQREQPSSQGNARGNYGPREITDEERRSSGIRKIQFFFRSYFKKIPNFLAKAFHPGNTLFVAFTLAAIGIGLVGFGVACPPALVIAALSFAAFSAVTAIGYGLVALKNSFLNWRSSINDSHGRVEMPEDFFGKFLDYLKYCTKQLKNWMREHPVQAGFMIAGALVFTAALIVTTGGLAGIPLFGFMTAGAAGGAIGLVSSFFSIGFGGLSASAVALASAICAGMALIVGPTNVLDTIRRFASGVWERLPERSAANISEDHQPMNSTVISKDYSTSTQDGSKDTFFGRLFNNFMNRVNTEKMVLKEANDENYGSDDSVYNNNEL